MAAGGCVGGVFSSNGVVLNLYALPQVVLVGDFNIAMSSKDVHPSIRFQGLYTVEELTIMKVARGEKSQSLC